MASGVEQDPLLSFVWTLSGPYGTLGNVGILPPPPRKNDKKVGDQLWIR